MSDNENEKTFLNEVLPDPKTNSVQAGSPRQRTTQHLRRIMAMGGVALPLAACSNGYQVVDSLPPPVVLPANAGFLELKSTPVAVIEVDGKPTGKSTVVVQNLPLSPGVHKIRLVVGSLEQTFEVEIKTGETVKIDRDLRNMPKP